MANINNKLLFFIRSLTESELTEFRKFIISPLYTSGRNYDTLLNEIIKFNSKESNRLTVQDLYSKLYPGKTYNPQTMKNRFSELLKLGEEFLVYRKIQDSPAEKDKLLLSSYLDRKMYKFLDSKLQKEISELTSAPDDLKKFENLFSLQELRIRSLGEKKKFDAYFQKFFENSLLSTSIFLNNLFINGIEYKQQEYLNRKYEFNLVLEILKDMNLAKVMKKCHNSDLNILKIVSMNYNLYKAYENINNEDNYFEARKIFHELQDSLSNEYKLELYMIFIYFCTRKQNQGINKYYNELFKLFNEKLDSGFHSDFSQNIYPLSSFRDYVFVGIEVNKLSWVDDFLKKYSVLLPEDVRDNEVNIANAKLFIARKKYQNALSIISGVKPSNFLHYIDVSLVKLISYYELGEYEDAFTLIDRTSHYMRNHKEIPKSHMVNFTGFIKFLHLLLNAATDTKVKDQAFLFNELNKYKLISKRDWLTEKISELNKQKKAV